MRERGAIATLLASRQWWVVGEDASFEYSLTQLMLTGGVVVEMNAVLEHSLAVCHHRHRRSNRRDHRGRRSVPLLVQSGSYMTR